MSSNPQLTRAVNQLEELKDQATILKLKISDAESKIEVLIPGKDEGTTSLENKGLKVSVVRKLNRSLDEKRYRDVYNTFGAGSPESDLLDELVAYKPSLVKSVLTAIETANPELYKLCAEFITVKPGKASISIKEVKAK